MRGVPFSDTRIVLQSGVEGQVEHEGAFACRPQIPQVCGVEEEAPGLQGQFQDGEGEETQTMNSPPMSTSDIISELSESDEDLHMLEYIVVKHCDSDKMEERIYFSNFERFVDYVFDLDIHGWELSSFNKLKYPRCPNSYSLFVGSVCAEFIPTRVLTSDQ